MYEYTKRTGSGLDEQSLDDIGEQTSLRQFDISDFTANRFSAIVVARLGSNLSVNGNGFVGNDNRPDTGFGLLSARRRRRGLRARLHPERRGVGRRVVPVREYSALQKSRQANPGVQFDDPTRDWTTDSGDHTHTFTASADLLKLVAEDRRPLRVRPRARRVDVCLRPGAEHHAAARVAAAGRHQQAQPA